MKIPSLEVRWNELDLWISFWKFVKFHQEKTGFQNWKIFIQHTFWHWYCSFFLIFFYLTFFAYLLIISQLQSWEQQVMDITAQLYSSQCLWDTCCITSTERLSPFWCHQWWRRSIWIKKNLVSVVCSAHIAKVWDQYVFLKLKKQFIWTFCSSQNLEKCFTASTKI